MKELRFDDNEFSRFINFAIKYFQRKEYKSVYTSLVSCFSLKPDSRLLWDAYTIHRPSNIACKYGENRFCQPSNIKYNGACIAFNIEKLKVLIDCYKAKVCDKVFLLPINYGKGIINSKVNEYLKKAALDSFEMLKTPEGQESSLPPIYIQVGSERRMVTLKNAASTPMLKLIFTIDECSPFYKHEFWKEEQEVRAALLIHNQNINKYGIPQDTYGSKYFDIPITEDCIHHIILGPEFGKKEKQELLQSNDFKIQFSKIKTKPSLGKGIIVNK